MTCTWGSVVLLVILIYPLVAHTQENASIKRAKELLDRCNEALDQKDYKAAIEPCTGAYAVRPHPELLLNTALAHQCLGRLDVATQILEGFLQETKSSTAARMQTVRDQVKRLRHLQQVLQGHSVPVVPTRPATPEARRRAQASLNQCNNLLDHKRHHDALLPCIDAYAVLPHPQLLLNLVFIYEALNRPADAIAILEQFLSAWCEGRPEQVDRAIVKLERLRLQVKNNQKIPVGLNMPTETGSSGRLVVDLFPRQQLYLDYAPVMEYIFPNAKTGRIRLDIKVNSGAHSLVLGNRPPLHVHIASGGVKHIIAKPLLPRWPGLLLLASGLAMSVPLIAAGVLHDKPVYDHPEYQEVCSDRAAHCPYRYTLDLNGVVPIAVLGGLLIIGGGISLGLTPRDKLTVATDQPPN